MVAQPSVAQPLFLGTPTRLPLHPLATASPAVAWSHLRNAAAPRRSGAVLALAASTAFWLLRVPFVRRARALPDVPVADPLFIVGFWRSATSLLQELLALDPGVATPRLAEALCPDDLLYLRRIKRRLLSRLTPATRGFDALPLSAKSPQEDELALAQLGAPSFFEIFYLPSRRQAVIEEALFLETAVPERRELWCRQLRRFHGLLAQCHPGKRLLIKNPAHSTRLPLLCEAYPKAGFVLVQRGPREAVRSFVKMVNWLTEQLSLEAVWVPLTEAEAWDLHERVVGRLGRDWERLADRRRAVVSYEELTRDPIGAVGRLYDDLGLRLDPVHVARMGRYWAEGARVPVVLPGDDSS